MSFMSPRLSFLGSLSLLAMWRWTLRKSRLSLTGPFQPQSRRFNASSASPTSKGSGGLPGSQEPLHFHSHSLNPTTRGADGKLHPCTFRRPTYGVWRPITPPLVLPTSCGLNMPTTPSSPRPLDYPPLNASSGITLHCFPRKRHRLTFPLPAVSSNAAGRPGGRLGVSFFRPPRDTNIRLTATPGRHLISEPVKESG